MTLDGAFLQDGAGSVQTERNIATTDEDVTLDQRRTLTSDVAMSTNGGTITFNDTIDGTFDLGLTTGTGDVVFDGAVGGTTGLADITISGAAVTVNDTVDTASGGSVTITNAGLLTLAAGADLTLDGGVGLDDLLVWVEQWLLDPLGPAAHWGFEGDYTDRVGEHDGTAVGDPVLVTNDAAVGTGSVELDGDDMVRMDLRYVESWSFLLDLRILVKTAGVVLRRVLEPLSGAGIPRLRIPAVVRRTARSRRPVEN